MGGLERDSDALQQSVAGAKVCSHRMRILTGTSHTLHPVHPPFPSPLSSPQASDEMKSLTKQFHTAHGASSLTVSVQDSSTHVFVLLLCGWSEGNSTDRVFLTHCRTQTPHSAFWIITHNPIAFSFSSSSSSDSQNLVYLGALVFHTAWVANYGFLAGVA